MGEAQTVGPTAIEFFNGKEYSYAAGDGDGVREGGGADGLENNKRWRPSTLADAVDVEIAMRVMSAARVEESVLVALADRRRDLGGKEGLDRLLKRNVGIGPMRDTHGE